MDEHPLAGARRKLRWASRQMDALQAEIMRYHKSEDPLLFVLKNSPEPPKYAFRLRLRQEPDTEFWGLIVGDVAHNLRCALDYLAWELTTLGPQGMPTKDDEIRKIQFPITTSKSWFRSSKVKPYLRSKDFDRIKQFQPYHRRHRHRHPLSVLAALTNEDKHRVPQVARPVLNCSGYTFNCVSGGTIKNVRRSQEVPMQQDAKLASFEVHKTGTDPPNVTYDSDPTFYVALANGLRVWGDGGSVYGTLGRIGFYVAKILNRFAPALGTWEGREAGRPFIWVVKG